MTERKIADGPKPPTKLYKYCPPERTDVVVSECIRFTPADTFNDPFEFIIRIENLLTLADVEQTVSYRELKQRADADIAKMLEEKLPAEALASMSRKERQAIKTKLRRKLRHMPAMTAKAAQTAKSFAPDLLEAVSPMFAKSALKARADFGVLCLTEKFDNYAMWAHYAADHSGIVLEFNMDEFGYVDAFSPKGLIWSPIKVAYLDDKVIDASDRESTPGEMLLSKHRDWSYEQEWRIVAPLKELRGVPDYKGFELVRLRRGSLGALYLGSDYFKNGRLGSDVIAAAVQQGVAIYVMEKKWADAKLRARNILDPIEPDAMERVFSRLSALGLS